MKWLLIFILINTYNQKMYVEKIGLYSNYNQCMQNSSLLNKDLNKTYYTCVNALYK